MGAGMDKIMPGVFVGSIRDSKDMEQLKKNNITHILSIYEGAKEGGIENITYKAFTASDHAAQDLKQFFEEAIDFIHNARLNNGNVLVHCMAGISRSTTLVISYIMTVCEMNWCDAMNAVRAARKGANPNYGFQRQLQNFEFTTLKMVRENLFNKYGHYENKHDDKKHCLTLLELYQKTELNQINRNFDELPVNVNPVKSYPFAFNSYNLDEEKPESEASSENQVVHRQQPDQTVDVVVNEPNEKEKEEFVNKLFG